MTNEEKLRRAIGEIDDELLKEASLTYKRRFTPATRGLTVAASVVLVSAAVLAASGAFLPKAFDNVGSDADASPGFNNAHPESNGGGEISSNDGCIYDIKAAGEWKISFGLLLYNDVSEPLEINVYGIDENGNNVLISTTDKSSDGYDENLAPIITVNLDTADRLPDKGGNYFVTVDLSSVFNGERDNLGYIEISGFGIVYSNEI